MPAMTEKTSPQPPHQQPSPDLEEIADLSSQVKYCPRLLDISYPLLSASRRAQQDLPRLQYQLEYALSTYRRAIAAKLAPWSFTGVYSKVLDALGLASHTSISNVYTLQLQCFEHMMEIVDDLCCEAQHQEQTVHQGLDELACWLDQAGPAITGVKEALRSRPEHTAVHGLTKYVQLFQRQDSRRRDRTVIQQAEIFYESRKSLLPALLDYATIISELAESIQLVKAHTIASAEYFERTLDPAQFLDSASTILPRLEKGMDLMHSYHLALGKSLEHCLSKLNHLSARFPVDRGLD